MTRNSINLIALPGSLRKQSFNRLLLQAAARQAPESVCIEVYTDLADVPLFDQDQEAENGAPAGVLKLANAIKVADGLLISTAEYNHSIPGVLKNAIDWLSRASAGEVLAGKPVAICGVTAGQWGTRLSQHALRQTLVATEAVVMPSPMLFVREGAKQFDATGALQDERTRAGIGALLQAFAVWIERASPITR